MSNKWLLYFGILIMLTGCMTTSPERNVLNQIQVRLVELEKRMEDKENEMVDLKYEIKALANRIEDQTMYKDRGTASYYDREASLPVYTTEIVDNSAATSEDDERIIRVNADPKDVQTALKKAGFYKGSVDGKIGSQSREAIKAFQKSHDLKSDGIIGQRTWNELKFYLN